ncbi:hypothetical protein ACFX10_001388 [Malus domestica]
MVSDSSSSLPNSSSPNPNLVQSYTSLTIQNIGSMVPIKLKSLNYLPWQALFAPILHRYKLLGVIDGSEPCPSPLLSDRSINPAFEQWYEKDQNLLTWLNSTLSEEIIPFTVGVSSSRDLWLKLEQRYGGISDAHIYQLRSRLQSLQKGSQSISEYVQQIKAISDSLTAVGASMSDRDLIAATLHGLPEEFDSFVDSITLCLSSTTLDELHGLLLTKELSMACRKKSVATEPVHAYATQNQPPLLPTPHSSQAYAAQHQPMQNSSRYNSNRGRNNNRFHNNRGNRNYHGNNRGSHSNSGFQRYNNQGFRSSSNPGVRNNCQICGSSSHEAIDCYDRMNPDIFGKVSHTKLAAMYTHYASKPSPSWILDSGATSHITHDISNISSPTPYTGEDKVYIGDGKGLSIHHTGSTLLNTAHASFKLNNVLHVP